MAGFDYNSDRICMVIVNRGGELLDFKTRRFPEVNSPGFPKDKARDIRRKNVVELVEYAANHNVTDYAIEKLEKSTTKTGSKKGNRKISRFSLRELAEHMKVLVPRVGGRLHQIEPGYTSYGGKLIARDLGVDVHLASAYVLALRFLKA